MKSRTRSRSGMAPLLLLHGSGMLEHGIEARYRDDDRGLTDGGLTAEGGSAGQISLYTDERSRPAPPEGGRGQCGPWRRQLRDADAGESSGVEGEIFLPIRSFKRRGIS